MVNVCGAYPGSEGGTFGGGKGLVLGFARVGLVYFCVVLEDGKALRGAH